MSTARDVVLDQVAGLTVAQVRPYARLNRQPAKLTLMVRTDEIEPSPNLATARVYSFSLIVLGTKFLTDDDEKGGVDDELDAAVELILHKLDEGITDLLWTSAKRGTYEPTNSPCYIIAAQYSGIYESEVTP